MKAIVDPEVCIGCGLCVEVAPDVFEMQADKAVPKQAEIPADKLEDAKNGRDQCPVSAITIV